MEDLKQIISENSHNWKEISLEEIQALDKNELAKNLQEITPDLQKDLKNALKNLISNNIQSVNNLQDNSSNNQIIIYAMQIYANLFWMKMPIDGVFNKDLISPDFKKLFSQKPQNISEKLWLPMEKLKNSKNLSEFLDTTLETLLKKYAQKLNSPEWIPLKTTEIYKELVVLLGEIDKNLPEGNIYKWKTHLIINNFLTPRENGEKLIKSVIDKVLNPNEKEIKSWDLDSLKIAIKWGFWTLIDVAKTHNEKELQTYINELKIKEILTSLLKDKAKDNPALLNVISELDKIFDLFISLLKTLDKNELNTQIDNFFEKNSNNLLKLANKKPWEKVDDKVKLDLVNWTWRIVDNLITNQRVNVALHKISQFEFLRKNPLVSQVIDIINNSKLSPDDKVKLFKEVSKLVLDVTNTELTKDLQSENIKKTLNSIIELLSKFNKEWKIDEQKVVKLVKEIINGWEEAPLIEKVKKLRNLKDLSSFLSDNFDTIKTLVWGKLKWWDWLEDAIKEFITKYKLSDNIAKAWWNLIERLEKAFSLNTADMILSIRKTLLEDNNSSSQKENSPKTETQKAAQDIWEIIVDKISKKWFELIKQKLSSVNNVDKKLTKEDIINTIFSSIWDIFNDKQLSNRIFENSKKLWAKIDNKEQFIQNLVTHFVNNPEFKSVINNVSTLLLSRLSNTKNISGEIDAIKNDINKLVSDFSKNYAKEWVNWAIKTFQETKIIDEKTKQELVWTSLSMVYEYIGKKENMFLLLQSFPEISKNLPKWISQEKILEIMQNFIKAIPKNVVWEILQTELSSGIKIQDYKSPEKVLQLCNKILSHKDVNKEVLLQTIIKADLWKVMVSEWNSTQKLNISKETISSWVDSLYTLLDWSSKEDINALVASLWLDKIFSGALDTTLKNIPKDTLKKALIWNIDFVNDAVNGNIDVNKWLKFASELYKDIPAEKRLLVVDDLVWSLSWGKEGSGWFKIDFNNFKYLTDMLYATLDTNDNVKMLNIASKLSPSLWNLLSQKEVFDKSNLSVWVSVLKSIPKEKFQNFLSKNSTDINNLITTNDKNIAIKLAVELFGNVDNSSLKDNLSKDKKLSKNESSIIDMSSSIQKSLEKNKDKITNLIKTWEKLKNHIDSWEKDITKSGLSKDEITKFSSDLFDIMHDTLNIELKNIMEKQWLSSIADARVQLAEKFQIPASNWDSKIDMSKISFMEFFMNNPGFSMYWWWAYIFKWQDYVVKNAGMDYFLDNSRKQNFTNITLGYFDLKG